jgi:hypothetical protein
MESEIVYTCKIETLEKCYWQYYNDKGVYVNLKQRDFCVYKDNIILDYMRKKNLPVIIVTAKDLNIYQLYITDDFENIKKFNI